MENAIGTVVAYWFITSVCLTGAAVVAWLGWAFIRLVRGIGKQTKRKGMKMDIQQIESTEDNEETIFDIIEDTRGAVETLHFQRKIVCENKDCEYRLNNGQCKFNFISIG